VRSAESYVKLPDEMAPDQQQVNFEKALLAVLQQTKQHNGKGEILRHPIVVLLLTTIISGVIAFINVAYITGTYQQRFIGLEGRTSVLESKQQTMNEKGTDYSRYGLQSDIKDIESMKHTIEVMQALTAKIPVMDATLSRLELESKEARNSRR
jgi:hypothetical protein